MAEPRARTDVLNADAAPTAETVRLQYQPPTDTSSGAARCTVLLCNPLPLAGDASRSFIDALRDALLEFRCAVATYEPKAESAILEDYHSYTAPQSQAEAHSALQQLLHTGIAADTIMIVGYGIGALIIAGLLDETPEVRGLCLINPVPPQLVTGPLARRSEKAGDSSEAALPRAFIDTVRQLDSVDAISRNTCPVLVLSGAGDDMVNPTRDRTYVNAAQHPERMMRNLVVAHGDHAFTNANARRAALAQVIDFIEALAGKS